MGYPKHIQDQIDAFSDKQRSKYYELLAWSGNAGKDLGRVDISTACQKLIDMVKQMGEDPITPIEPDRTVNHDWDIISRKRTNS